MTSSLDMKQELSYRKQIAHQLRTQYVQGIHRNLSVTFRYQMKTA